MWDIKCLRNNYDAFDSLKKSWGAHYFIFNAYKIAWFHAIHKGVSFFFLCLHLGLFLSYLLSLDVYCFFICVAISLRMIENWNFACTLCTVEHRKSERKSEINRQREHERVCTHGIICAYVQLFVSVVFGGQLMHVTSAARTVGMLDVLTCNIFSAREPLCK